MVAFWILAPLIVLAALGILFTRKPVHCALLLAVVMISLAILYLAQDAPFLAVVQVIVYTGAILMLFLFVVMLVGVDSSDSVVETIRGQRVIATLVGLLFAAVLVLGIGQAYVGTAQGLGKAGAEDNVPALAGLLFTRYVLAFELTSALLITAALGAMVLAHRERLVPKLTQADVAARRVREYADAGRHLGPLPPPGTFARHNAVDTPALLPDGTPAPTSVSQLFRSRGAVATAPHDVEEIGAEIGVPEDQLRPTITAAPEPGDVVPEPDEYPGSLRPTADGSAPAGHPIKGNKASGLYHEPTGRWYAVTVAEVWFDTVDSAEAAGFTRAGSRKNTKDS